MDKPQKQYTVQKKPNTKENMLYMIPHYEILEQAKVIDGRNKKQCSLLLRWKSRNWERA